MVRVGPDSLRRDHGPPGKKYHLLQRIKNRGSTTRQAGVIRKGANNSATLRCLGTQVRIRNKEIYIIILIYLMFQGIRVAPYEYE